MEQLETGNDHAGAQSRLTVGLGDEFTYMGVNMVCIARQARIDNFFINCVEAHYFNANGDLKTCILPPNSWGAIKSPNV